MIVFITMVFLLCLIIIIIITSSSSSSSSSVQALDYVLGYTVANDLSTRD